MSSEEAGDPLAFDAERVLIAHRIGDREGPFRIEQLSGLFVQGRQSAGQIAEGGCWRASEDFILCAPAEGDRANFQLVFPDSSQSALLRVTNQIAQESFLMVGAKEFVPISKLVDDGVVTVKGSETVMELGSWFSEQPVRLRLEARCKDGQCGPGWTRLNAAEKAPFDDLPARVSYLSRRGRPGMWTVHIESGSTYSIHIDPGSENRDCAFELSRFLVSDAETQKECP